VIVVIGILAAITIVAFNGVTQRAQVASIKSDLDGAAKQLAIDQVTNSAYPATVAAANGGAGLKASPGTTYQYSVDNSASPQTFCITANNGTTSYFVSSTNNVPTAGGCPVTNLTTNPSLETDMTTWQAPFGAGDTATRVTSMSYSGSASLLLQRTAVISDSRMGRQILGSLPIGSYIYSSWVYVADAAIGNVSLNVEFPGGAGTMVSGTTSGGVIGQWKRVSVPFNVTTVGSNVLIDFVAGQNQLGSLYVDAALLEGGTTLNNYGDGNSAGWIWNGTPNDSTSTGPPL
jgi:type II secretory pathway pseudopilin PulG